MTKVDGTRISAPAKRVTDEGDRTRIVIDADGVVGADLTISDGGKHVRLCFTVSHDHLPRTARRDLVDAVFALPELAFATRLEAAIPLGDVDLITGLRAHLTNVSSRAAGATCLIDASI